MRRKRMELFKGRHFEAEMIVLSVRWYLRFGLSFRDERVGRDPIVAGFRLGLRERSTAITRGERDSTGSNWYPRPLLESIKSELK